MSPYTMYHQWGQSPQCHLRHNVWPLQDDPDRVRAAPTFLEKAPAYANHQPELPMYGTPPAGAEPEPDRCACEPGGQPYRALWHSSCHYLIAQFYQGQALLQASYYPRLPRSLNFVAMHTQPAHSPAAAQSPHPADPVPNAEQPTDWPPPDPVAPARPAVRVHICIAPRFRQ